MRGRAARYAVARELVTRQSGGLPPLHSHRAMGCGATLRKQARGGNYRAKTIVTITAAAFLGADTLAPVPAHAFFLIPFFVPVMLAKKDPNFKAQNPYAPVKVAKKAKGKKKKM